MIQDRQEQRWRPGQHRHFFSRDATKCGGYIEHHFGNDGCATDETAENSAFVAERVKEGVDDEESITTNDTDCLLPIIEHPNVLSMIRHHALRATCRAAREEDVREVVG